MSDDKGLINIDLSGLGDAATKLIEKVSDGIGGAFAPRQLVRMAKAQAEADAIAAHSQIEISDLQRRALSRLAAEEARKQENIERITMQAIPLLEDHSQPENMDEDWIANFFEKSRIVSDQEMQSLWSRLLATEANAPGSVSKRAINLLSDLDKSDAEAFSTLCNFGWMFGKFVPLIFREADDIVVRNGLNYEVLVHLESLGLIRLSSGEFSFTFTEPGLSRGLYFDKSLIFEMKNTGPFNIGKVVLTATGSQLAKIARTGPIEGVFEYVKDHYERMNLLHKP